MIVFLDIDGVLNSDEDLRYCEGTPAYGSHYTCVISREKVALLNRIPAALPDVRFVLSTSWRDEYFALDSLGDTVTVRALLSKYGFKGTYHKDWRTPCQHMRDVVSRRDGWIRGDEVFTWLANNGFSADTRHVILDDMGLPYHFHPGQPLVQTDARVGLTDADVDTAIAILTEVS